MEIRTIEIIKNIISLPEGDSSSLLAEGEDDFKYIIRFKEGTQGTRALIAELLSTEIARILQISVPEAVFLNINDPVQQNETDTIQNLIKNNYGLNLGLHYLPGARMFNRETDSIAPPLASRIVWLDAFLTNPDRTTKTPNILVWNTKLWLINQQNSLYFHYTWNDIQEKALNPFPTISEHILLKKADQLLEADQSCKEVLTNEKIREIVSLIPDEWLNWDNMQNPEEMREVYFNYLTERLGYSEIFVKEALNAKEIFI